MTKTHSRSRCEYPLLEPLPALDCAPQQGGTPPTVFLGRFLPKLGGAFRCRLFFGLAAAGTEPVPKTEGGAAARDLPGWLGCWLRLKPAESIPKPEKRPFRDVMADETGWAGLTFPLVHPGWSRSDATEGQPAPTTGRPSSCLRPRWPDCGTSSRGAFSCEKGVDGGALGRHKPPPAARWSTSSRLGRDAPASLARQGRKDHIVVGWASCLRYEAAVLQ
jgi:hypothetical protein